MTGEVLPNHPFAHDAFTEDQTAKWEQLKQQLPIGSLLAGKVWARMPFGVFFDAGVGFPVLLEVVQFGKERARYPEDYPELASEVTGRLADFSEHNRQLRVVNLALAWPIESAELSK